MRFLEAPGIHMGSKIKWAPNESLSPNLDMGRRSTCTWDMAQPGSGTGLILDQGRHPEKRQGAWMAAAPHNEKAHLSTDIFVQACNAH